MGAIIIIAPSASSAYIIIKTTIQILINTVYTWFILSYSHQIKTTKVGKKCGNKWKQAIHNLRQNKIGRVYRIDHHKKCIDFLLVLKRMQHLNIILTIKYPQIPSSKPIFNTLLILKEPRE